MIDVRARRSDTKGPPIYTERQQRLLRSSGNVSSADPLVLFLYHLMRDSVPTSVISEAVEQVATAEGDQHYTNGHLARFAWDCAVEIRRRPRLDGRDLAPTFVASPCENVSERPSTPRAFEVLARQAAELCDLVEAAGASPELTEISIRLAALSDELAKAAK